jgi:RimJ/RimL family protein N-acetyltransferase
MRDYIFTSKRLGFRNWKTSDINGLFEINSNKEAMQFFPSTQTKEQTEAFITKMQNQYAKKGFCYFAVEILGTKEFIGFTGLSCQNFEADFTPAIDIGWRLHPNFWNKGLATEGAERCLEFGFNQLKLKKIIAVSPVINVPSISIMKKIRMTKVKSFNHSLLKEFPQLESCVLYAKKNT